MGGKTLLWGGFFPLFWFPSCSFRCPSPSGWQNVRENRRRSSSRSRQQHPLAQTAVFAHTSAVMNHLSRLAWQVITCLPPAQLLINRALHEARQAKLGSKGTSGETSEMTQRWGSTPLRGSLQTNVRRAAGSEESRPNDVTDYHTNGSFLFTGLICHLHTLSLYTPAALTHSTVCICLH